MTTKVMGLKGRLAANSSFIALKRRWIRPDSTIVASCDLVKTVTPVDFTDLLLRASSTEILASRRSTGAVSHWTRSLQLVDGGWLETPAFGDPAPPFRIGL
jgi:hypothetical protein